MCLQQTERIHHAGSSTPLTQSDAKASGFLGHFGRFAESRKKLEVQSEHCEGQIAKEWHWRTADVKIVE